MNKYKHIDARCDVTIGKLREDPNHVPQAVNLIDRVHREYVKWLSDQRENNTDTGTVWHALNQLVVNLMMETAILTIPMDKPEAQSGVPVNMLDSVGNEMPKAIEWARSTGFAPLALNIPWPPEGIAEVEGAATPPTSSASH